MKQPRVTWPAPLHATAALRAELSSAESRLAAERKAHQASRVAAAARESDLEAQIAGSTAALGDLTRSLEDANRKARGELGCLHASSPGKCPKQPCGACLWRLEHGEVLKSAHTC